MAGSLPETLNAGTATGPPFAAAATAAPSLTTAVHTPAPQLATAVSTAGPLLATAGSATGPPFAAAATAAPQLAMAVSTAGPLLATAGPSPAAAAPSLMATATGPLLTTTEIVTESLLTATAHVAVPLLATAASAAGPLLATAGTAAGPLVTAVTGVAAPLVGGLAGVTGQLVGGVTEALVEPVLRIVHVTTVTVLGPVAPIVEAVLPTKPVPSAAGDEQVGDQQAATERPGPGDVDDPSDQGDQSPPASAATAAVEASAPADAVRGTWAFIGPRIGATSGITKPPQRRLTPPGGAAVRTAPTLPWPGLAGRCGAGGCAHTTDAIGSGGQPLVLPAVIAVRPDVRGLLVAAPAGPAFADRLPGVSPLPG